MGLISRMKEKLALKRRGYDVNAPISEYTETQIIRRIYDELGEDAARKYENYYRIEDSCFRYYSSFLTRPLQIPDKYFINDFFKSAVVRKSKKEYYRDLKSNAQYRLISEKESKEGFAKIDFIAEETVKRYKKKMENQTKNMTANAPEMQKIDALFEDELKK